MKFVTASLVDLHPLGFYANLSIYSTLLLPQKILYTVNCKLPKSSCKLPKFSLSARSHNGICMKEIILGGSNWRKKSPCIGATVSASVSFLLRVLIPMVTVFINLGERIILMSPSCYWALQSVLPRLFSSWQGLAPDQLLGHGEEPLKPCGSGLNI